VFRFNPASDTVTRFVVPDLPFFHMDVYISSLNTDSRCLMVNHKEVGVDKQTGCQRKTSVRGMLLTSCLNQFLKGSFTGKT